jgi:hypothetical protein
MGWRGAFTNAEVNALHAETFETKVFDKSEWNWAELVHRRNLGSVLARDGDLVGSSTCCGTAWCTPGCNPSWSPADHSGLTKLWLW